MEYALLVDRFGNSIDQKLVTDVVYDMESIKVYKHCSAAYAFREYAVIFWNHIYFLIYM